MHTIPVLLVAFLLAGTSVLNAQTRELLGAPRVQSRIRVQWDPALRKIVVAVDEDDRFRTFAPLQPVVADGPIAVTYQRLNPLRVRATVTLREDSPRIDPLMAQLRALLSLATVSVPTLDLAENRPASAAAGSSAQCDALSTAQVDVEALMSRLAGLRGSITVPALFLSWRRAIDEALQAGQDGPTAVKAAMVLMGRVVAQLDRQIGDSDRILSRIEGELQKIGAPGACENLARTLYSAVHLTNQRARIAQLSAVRAAIVRIQESLSRDHVPHEPATWQGSEFRLAADVRATQESPIVVSIHVTDLHVEVDESSGALTAIDESSAAQTLVIQRFSRFTRDFAVATVIGTVTRPTYGTTTNSAGVTVVGRLRQPRASVEPAAFASFVCRCQTGPLIAPMLQIGVTTSKDVPALLAGGGIRLFGLPKGDVAFGAGAMIAWVKDLRTLKVGDPTGGTSDIDADLHHVRRHGGYFALQYKF